MIESDLLYANNFPYFNKLLLEGARVNNLKSVYPSLTYVCHNVMSTGAYPDKTGILNNEAFEPDNPKLPWLWYHDKVKCEDIFDVCKKIGLTTASVGWPTTGNHKNIDYLVNEIWPFGEPDNIESYKKAYIQSGTKPELYDLAVKPFIDLRIGRTQPNSSFFLTEVACVIIKNYQPDVMLIHVGNIDKYRHLYGVNSPQVKRGIEESEVILEKLFTATKEADLYENTNFVLTSDHGQIDVVRSVCPNVLLAKNGFITLDENGGLLDWKCFVASAGTSAQVYLKNPNDKELENKIFNFFTELSKKQDSGISEVWTKDYLKKKERIEGEFFLALETDGKTAFLNNITGNYIINHDKPKGSHGFHPDKGPNPVFVGYGPAFKKSAVLSSARLVDGAPTYAHILGTKLPNADGRALIEILNEDI